LELLHSAGRLAAHLGVPLVYDDHELGLEKLGQGSETLLSGLRKRIDGVVTGELRRRGSTVESRWIPRAVAVFAGSPLYAGVLEERYRRKVTPLLNVPWRSALPPDPRLRSEAQLPPAAKVALYQGTITPGGGGQQCIHAARSFPPGWYLVFLGVTWMRDRLGALAKEAGVEDRVRFLKAVPPIELPGWTRAADIGLAPIRAVNLGQEYSLANKVFEYLHAGLPIVSSDIRGQAALVRELDAGVVLAEVTPESIASAVNLLARIPDSERRATSERLRSVAETRYCWEIESEKLVTEYQRSVFAGPGGVPGGTTDPKR
jgi:glycosyltransferase involved in cell wall biosynthesis